MEELLANAEETGLLLYQILNAVLLFGGLLAAPLLLLHHRRNPPDGVALTRTLQARALHFTDIYGIVLLYLTLFIVAMFTGRFFYPHQIPVAKLAIALLIYSIVSFTIFAVTWRHGHTLESGFGMGGRSLRYGALAPLFYLAIIPLLLGCSFMLRSLGYELPLQSAAQQYVESNPVEQVLFVIMAVVGAPFFEELLFRGILFPAVLKRMDLPATILLVSSLFALLHFHFFIFLALFAAASVSCLVFWPVQFRVVRIGTRLILGLVVLFSAWITFVNGSFHSFLSLMILSGALCLAYWRTGSLWPSILLHAIFNGVTLLSLGMVG